MLLHLQGITCLVQKQKCRLFTSGRSAPVQGKRRNREEHEEQRGCSSALNIPVLHFYDSPPLLFFSDGARVC